VFLPGWQAIAEVYEALQQHPTLGGVPLDANALNPDGVPDARDPFQPLLQLHVLHSLVPMSEQQEVFEPAPEGGWWMPWLSLLGKNVGELRQVLHGCCG
jgi:HrpA-like RNA helicase